MLMVNEKGKYIKLSLLSSIFSYPTNFTIIRYYIRELFLNLLSFVPSPVYFALVRAREHSIDAVLSNVFVV